MAGYWNTNYWNANYWQANYWAPTGSITGDYWNDRYWNATYWSANYWLEVNDGDVNQFNTPNLALTPIAPTVNVGLNVFATTAGLSFATFQADANYDISVTATTADLVLTPFDASVGLQGYQLGDVDIRLVPDSAQDVTYGVIASTPNLPFGPMAHTVEEGGGINVAASLASLDLTSFVTDSRLDIEVEPLPASIAFTAFDTTAGIGTQVPVTLASIGFNTATHTVEATAAQADVFPLPGTLDLSPFPASVTGFRDLSKPESTFGDYGALIVNANATTGPTNYEICARTGFRVLPGELVKDGYGELVRMDSRDPVHPQDMVRSVPEKQKGSPRPEQVDRFIGEDVPRVVGSDL